MFVSLKHHGPDGEGIEHNASAILGHRRLSIIDLAADGSRDLLRSEIFDGGLSSEALPPPEPRIASSVLPEIHPA